MSGSVQPLILWWRSRGDLLQDAVLAAVVLAVAFAPPFAGSGLALGDLARHPLGVPGSALAVAQALPLVTRRRWPGPSMWVVGVAFACFQLAGYVSSFASVGLIVSVYSAGAHAGAHRRALAGAATVGYAWLAIALARLGSPERPIDWFTFYVLLVACWGAGNWMRTRAAAEMVQRRQGVERAIAEERARIAREMHDVVTHHVTAMVVQADAARFVLDTAPGRAADGLAAISGAGRRALTELRHLLGLLTPAGDSQPAGDAADRAPVAGSLHDLVASISSSGYPTELIELGRPEPMSAGLRVAVYRVVQESLTNAMKHAPGQSVVAEIRYEEEEICIDVSNDGPVLVDGSFTVGRGLTGLGERVERRGGHLQARGRPDGGFTVRARMPRVPELNA